MEFGSPQYLWFLVILPFFVVLHYRSFSDMGRFQRGFSLFLRLAVLVAIILALADLRLVQHSDKLSVFFLWDGSHSVGEGSGAGMRQFVADAVENSDEEKDTSGLIVFGRDPLVEAGLGSDLSEIESISSDIGPDFTNLGGALDLALASLPADTGARIVLLTDGNENLGDAVASARIAANRGVQIDAVPFGMPTEEEVTAGRLILPRRVEEDEMYEVRAVVESESETDALVEVYENEELIGSQSVHLSPGKNVFTFPRRQPEGGFYSYRVQVIADADIQGENNTATDYTIVEGSPKVLYVSGDPNEDPYMVNALTGQGIQAHFRDISGLPTSLVDMAPYDVIMFSDVGGELLMPETMRAYQSYVRDLGGAFAMVGGENSFGPGGYFRTPIEEMLPVDLDLSRKEMMPSIAIALVVDKSGSMAGMGRGGALKIEIAKAACSLVVELLDYTDQVGVIAFDGMGQWVVPLEQIEDLDEIDRMIGTMRAGGGTAVYAGMEPAYQALRQADVKIRHMIVLSDGVTAPGDFYGLIDRMNAENITLTTISIGMDANVQLMEDLANRAGGTHYFTDDIRSVPQIFTKETFLISNRALVEEPFHAIPNQSSPITDSIDWDDSPPLLGYVATNIKPLATEALTTARVDPLLAHWQYGLGRSLAFTSDAKAHWAASWLNWPGFGQVWTQAARWLVGGAMPGNMVPNIYFRAGKAFISVDAIDPSGEMITDAVINARVALPDSTFEELDLFQVAPGRYEASLEATQIGSYLVNIYRTDSDGDMIDQVSSGFSVSYPPEYESSGPDMFLLSQLTDITGGMLDASPLEVFRHTNQPISRYLNLWYYLLMAAILLLPLDIALRRLSLTGESLQYVRNRISSAVVGAMERRRREREAPTHIDQLKKIKEQYRLAGREEDEKEVDRRIDEILDSKTKETIRRAKMAARKPPEKPKEPSGEEISEGSPMDRLLKAKKRVWKDEDDHGSEDEGK